MKNTKKITTDALLLSLLCIISPISIPTVISPINITLQTLVLTIITILRGKNSFLIIFGYLIIGGLGLPVFSGFKGGFSVLIGPSGGFLLGFLFFPLPIIRFLNDSISKVHAFLIFLLSHLIVYLPGLLWLKLYLGISLIKLFKIGFIPFLPGDLIKIVICTILFKSLISFKNRLKI